MKKKYKVKEEKKRRALNIFFLFNYLFLFLNLLPNPFGKEEKKIPEKMFSQ